MSSQYHPLRRGGRRVAVHCAVICVALHCLCASTLPAQAPMSLADMIATARARSPELRGAEAAVQAAAGQERQAGAFANPVVAYGREQTSRAGQSNAQNILQIEQPLPVGGVRSAQREAARLRREGAEAQVQAVRARLDADVARAYALMVAASQRQQVTEQFAAVFSEARRVSDARLAAGDVSGYAARRLRLEAARFAATRAGAALELRQARVALASLLGRPVSSAESVPPPADLSDLTALLTRVTPDAEVSLDSLVQLGLRQRPDVRVARLEAAAIAADGRAAERNRIPVPVLSAGHKDERVSNASGGAGGFNGFVAGIAIPLPLFDRRAGAVTAAAATARVGTATVDALLQRVAREVADAADALRSAEAQRSALAPSMGDETRLALTAVQTSYTEGEISLVEWLDAVRAFQEAQAMYVTLVADVAIRRSALALALGLPLVGDSRATGSDAAAAPSRKN